MNLKLKTNICKSKYEHVASQEDKVGHPDRILIVHGQDSGMSYLAKKVSELLKDKIKQ